MANITLSILDELYRRMKRHPEVRWSKIVRKAIADYIAATEGEIPIEILADSLSDVTNDMKNISLTNAEEHYRRMVRAEWERLSMIQTG